MEKEKEKGKRQLLRSQTQPHPSSTPSVSRVVVAGFKPPPECFLGIAINSPVVSGLSGAGADTSNIIPKCDGVLFDCSAAAAGGCDCGSGPELCSSFVGGDAVGAPWW